MKVTISGKKIDIGSALREYVESDLIGSVTKYFEQAVSADVVFSKSRHLFSVTIVVNEGTGVSEFIKANADDDDVYAAYDKASEKIKKRLRRYKDRIKSHHKESLKLGSVAVIDYVLSAEEEHHESDEERLSPLIIAENSSQLDILTVSDAVMRMDLGELPAFMFVNKKTNAVNMVYRRADGNISWLDPQLPQQLSKGENAA